MGSNGRLVWVGVLQEAKVSSRRKIRNERKVAQAISKIGPIWGGKNGELPNMFAFVRQLREETQCLL